MKNYIIYFLTACFTLITLGSIQAQTPNLAWATGIGVSGDPMYQNSSKFILDDDDNVYSITRRVFGSTNQYTLLTKYNSAGTLLWQKRITEGNSRGIDIALDSAGNIYILGVFENTVDFDAGDSVYTLSSNGLDDVFIQKLDNTGNFIWVKSIGSNHSEGGNDLHIDDRGDIYITGFFRHTVDFDPEDSVYMLSSNGQSDIFVLKLNSMGGFVWVKSAGSSGLEVAFGVCVDKEYNVYITGAFGGDVDFDTGEGTHILQSEVLLDVFVWKLDSLGDFIWVRNTQGEGNTINFGRAIQVDERGNIYTTGHFAGTVDFESGDSEYKVTSNGSSDIFIHKLDSTGNLVWVRTFGDVNSDQGADLFIDKTQNIYVSGIFTGTVDFDPSDSVYNLSSNGGADIFVQKLDSAGELLWALSLGGSSGDGFLLSAVLTGMSVGISSDCGVYISNVFRDRVDFDRDTGSADTNWIGVAGDPNFHAVVTKFDQEQEYVVYTTDMDTVIKIACGFYAWAGKTYTESGIYTDTFCDVIKTLRLTIKANTVGRVDSVHSCDSYVWRGETYMNSGTYTEVLDVRNSVGCDSVDMLHLTIAQSTERTLIDTIIACDSYTWAGKTYTQKGVYRDTLSVPNSAGCDSVVTIDLTIYDNKKGQADTVVSCDSYVWRGVLYTTSGEDSAYLQTTKGCDSLLTLHLTINTSSVYVDTVIACNSHTWDGVTYTESTIGPMDTLSITNSVGCDSVLRLHLIIIKTQDTVNVCDSYVWADGVVYTQDTVVTDTFSIASCGDNIASTLYLTVAQSSPSVRDTVIMCDAYMWRDSVYTMTGYYVDSLLNIFGCDSLFELSLNIIEDIDAGIIQETPVLTARLEGGSYQWLYCETDSIGETYSVVSGATERVYTATENGSYAVEVSKYSCVDTSQCVVITRLGIEALRESQGLEIHIYPSPTKGEVFIELGTSYERVFVVVRDVFGRVLQDEQYADVRRLNTRIEGSAGMYYIEVSNDKGNRGVFRVIKQ